MMHLISDKLVELVEKHSEVIVKRWVKRLLQDPSTSSFTEMNMDYVEKKARNMLSNLGDWVSYDTTKIDIGRRFADEGKDYFDMGVPLCETHRALTTLRRILWMFVVNESAFDSAFQLHQMRELNDRVILFFDRIEYYHIRGYTEEMNKRLKEEFNLSSDDTEKVFFEHSFYNK